MRMWTNSVNSKGIRLVSISVVYNTPIEVSIHEGIIYVSASAPILQGICPDTIITIPAPLGLLL